MTKKLFCGDCGIESIPTGVLWERKPVSINAVGETISPAWEKVGAMCDYHLKINGEVSIMNGNETKIEPLLPSAIETKD